MDGANADSDHSMTWEDFFGSTTDLTPTLIGIYDSLLAQGKSLRPETEPLETAKDARNDPPVPDGNDTLIKETKDKANQNIEAPKHLENFGKEHEIEEMIAKDPSKIAGGVKLPITSVNKSSLYTLRTNSDENGASDKSDVSSDSVIKNHFQRTYKESKDTSAFGNLSPNVKRMISSATETTTLKFQKKTVTTGRSSTRHRSNIPLVGATSKISQSGVDILPSVEIYDQPYSMRSFGKSKSEDNEINLKPNPVKAEFKLDEPQTYDVPTNNRPAIYDVPSNKTAFESLSLPYIDQSIELSITSNDREFDIKLSSKDNSPVKVETNISPKGTPAKIPKIVNGGTNSLNRKDFKESPSKLTRVGPYPETVGSTGNLKSSEKEVTRLNPAVEVTRPLSMSSIASSSSTSSSGVQNKGGVNSAYLASIESLDDHSDADMTSANGSNNFVNNAGVKTSVSEERRSESPRQTEDLSGPSQLERVCAEIVQTEHVYVEDLRQVVEGYLHEWRREATFSEDELDELFNNIEDIYAFNRSLCEELNSCHLDATCIARCFVDNTAGFSVYTSYCTGYPRTMERLAALASNKQSAREFRERQIALGHPLPLASYLLKPVQRILKYHLLLQNVVKQCASRETEYALLKMTGIAQHIDDMKRRHEHAVRVQEIQSLLYGWNGPDLTTYGELCAEGTFRVFGAKAMRHAFLFDKMLLVTKNREDGILAYKSHIMCNNMMLVESIAGAPLSFHVIPWDAPRAQLTLQARSHRHKREWTLLLKRVILENYNAVIPSHARQLVMELGQNKTDDDMLAEKSHNLITQASMRKQLSAPEYLEKRKLERERRKIFESGIRGRLKKANRKYTVPNSRTENNQECDCVHISGEKGADYTCDNCYVDLCSDCENELNKDKVKDEKCSCSNDPGERCPECDGSLHYIDAGSAEHLERKPTGCKCSDFQSSQESFSKEFPNSSSLTKTRGYHSSDNIVGYTDNSKSKEDLTEGNNSLLSVRNIQKTCLKCAKIKENIPLTDLGAMHSRKSRCNDTDKKPDIMRSKSKDDPQRSKLSKIGTWRRKSEPGLQQNPGIVIKKPQDCDSEKNDSKGSEKIEFECRNCGSNKITRKVKINEGTVLSDPESENKRRGNLLKPNIEIKMYNSKNIPKKISKLKKNRTKGLRLGSDTTAKFYADLSTDVSTENILHISESNDSLNVEKTKDTSQSSDLPDSISKDEDIDEETYKKLIEKTDSFKKNELEKVKYLNKQKVINEGSEVEEINEEVDKINEGVMQEGFETTEQPLEQIISQLLMQNREFQKILKKQQLRNSAQRRHQRLLKSHSNPEPVILNRSNDSLKFKPKYGRQSSENLDTSKNEDTVEHLSPTNEVDDISEEDHIYETLRVENRVPDATNKAVVQQNSGIPRRLPSPPKLTKHLPDGNRTSVLESDYVYLSFDKINGQNSDGIYDVPVKSPAKVDQQQSNDYYVTMESQGLPISNEDNLYDNLVKVRRKKDVPSNLPGEYLPMSPDQQSPNTPEIWLSRQKEHFNVSRDRKSGSLPRSFQVVTSSQEENNLSTFKCKPNSNSKTYLNREGKVLSIDRPFTIASDQSEISYDDVENYMTDGDILKFNKKSKSNEADYVQNISQSTLELEEEIDRCYKTNFEDVTLDKNKNESIITTSQPNLNTSVTSSCEIIAQEQIDDKPKDIEIIHPEHKIYKPTSNMLSLKNVLSRFRNRTPNKNSEDTEINANEENSPESIKTDLKSPTAEKRSALNPRSYSKNLLQRFRSIIGDEHPDDNQNKTESKSTKAAEDSQNNLVKSEVTVVVTSTDTSPTTSTTSHTINSDLLSKSVYEKSTLTESQNEKNNLDVLSHSCDNINQKSETVRPSYEKSVSMVTSVSSISSIISQSKSNNSSYQTLNKLPIYMQGSKLLGARIAQSDYADPTKLVNEKSPVKNVNVLINKSAVRPDSLFSNSSFVTSSSEGAYQESKTNGSQNNETNNIKEKTLDRQPSVQAKSDESYYEKSFEKIEQVTDEDVFRDSAVYSDQDDNEDGKTDSKKTVTRVESIKRNASLKTHKVTVTTMINEKNSLTTRTIVTSNKFQQNNESKSPNLQTNKSKIAPPVPVKPKITSIPTTGQKSFVHRNSNHSKSQEETSPAESVNTRTIKRNTNIKSVARSESTPTKVNEDKADVKEKKEDLTIDTKEEVDGLLGKARAQGNIQIKRLSFERASLDSATRKIKTNEKRLSIEPPKVTTKSVLERRMEIEQLSRSQIGKPATNIKKPVQISKPKSITTKVAKYERSVSDNGKQDSKIPSTNFGNIPQDKNSINEPKVDNDELRGSWVKQVVNKFQ